MGLGLEDEPAEAVQCALNQEKIFLRTQSIKIRCHSVSELLLLFIGSTDLKYNQFVTYT